MSRDRKETFARALLAGKSPYEAALACVGRQNTEEAWSVCCELEFDSEVASIKKAIAEEEGDVALGLPSRADFIRQMWNRMQSCLDEDYAKIAKVYAETRGYGKDQASSATTTNTNNVLVVHDYGSSKDWETKAESQQSDLLKKVEKSQAALETYGVEKH